MDADLEEVLQGADIETLQQQVIVLSKKLEELVDIVTKMQERQEQHGRAIIRGIRPMRYR